MNKIKQAFSTIKVDKGLKEKTYLAIKEKEKKYVFPFKPVIIVNTVLAITLIIIFNNKSNKPNEDKAVDMGVNVLSESMINNFNSFVYNGSSYTISDMLVKTSDLDTNLGLLKNVITNVMDGYQDYELYTIKNNDNILVIKNGNNLYPYQKQ